MINRLAWDSICFGYEVGMVNVANELELQQFMEESTAYQLVYIFSKKDLGSLPTPFKKVDEKITLEISRHSCGMAIQKYEHNPVGQIIALDAVSDSVLHTQAQNFKREFLDLALLSGEYSRFRVDERLRNGEYKKLYIAWAEKSLKRDDKAFVFLRRNKLNGLITFSSNGKGKFKIELLAVLRQSRGQGIGSLLIDHACAAVRIRASQSVEVTTQKANKKALSFYLERGFNIIDEQNVYHWWRG